MSSGFSNSSDTDKLDNSDINFHFDLDLGKEIPDPQPAYTNTQEPIEPIRFGSIFKSAPPEDPLDWALVKIDEPSAIQYADKSFLDLVINEVQLADRRLYPSSLRGSGEGRVLICLGSPEVAIEGKLSSASSFIKIVGSKVFQELWQVNRFDGSFGKRKT